MYLPPQAMPISFVGQALFWAANSDLLNPINNGQGIAQRYIGKPLRVLVRLVYHVALSVFLAPWGAVYHGLRAGVAVMNIALYGLKRGLPSKDAGAEKLRYSRLAKEHLKAAWLDISSLSGMTDFAGKPNQGVAHYFNRTLVKGVPITVQESDDNRRLLENIKQSADSYSAINLKHREDMGIKGLYRHDMLIHQSLAIRESTGSRPKDLLEARVRIACFASTLYGTYGKYSYS